MALKLYFTILLFFMVTTNLLSNELEYPVWLEKFKIRAEKSGISKKTINETLNQVKIIPRVIELDRNQPEFTLTLSQYLNNVVSKKRTQKGISKIRENWILLENLSELNNKCSPSFDHATSLSVNWSLVKFSNTSFSKSYK